jgi:hypothetical protein
MTSSLLLIFAFALPAVSADQSNNPHQDVIVWPNGMPPAGITHKEDFGNHILSISHREKDDRPATHRAERDTRQRDQGRHQDRSQSRRCHPHPHRHTAPVFPRSRQADHIHAGKSRRSAQSKSLKIALQNRSETRVKHVSHLSHGSNSINSITVGTLNGSLSHRIFRVRLKN